MGPRRLALYRSLRGLIESGQMRPGDKLEHGADRGLGFGGMERSNERRHA